MNYRLRNLPTRVRGWKAEVTRVLARGGFVAPIAELSAIVLHADGSRTDLGVLSRRVVTNNGVAYLVDALQNITEAENLNFHDAGTGVGAEAAADSALGTPFGGARITGTQSEPASNQYRTLAVIPFTSSLAITEHGVFSASSVGTLFDRSVFSAINVVNGDSIQFTYTLTLTAGS